MKVVVQRVKKAKVTVDGQVTGEIGQGLLLLVGIKVGDTEAEADFIADKISGLRIFEDDDQKMNLSVKDVGGEILSVSQFTLYGDVSKGRRPNFMEAAKPHDAERLYTYFNEKLRANGLPVETGVFGAMMAVELINDGPVTIIVEK
ncbi:D-aminoacyl-tRNA deacylase [Tuberibacillus calidus]|jgi:D-tyrosyl-tRNA(Tyr) deacylase|uniref:D-aminoacyl-tRNA deacylase n=1 Tax=Tuberibacillus calidus TaxID=340097 RepID=UPI0004250777|nr:D-aminoacyl-tRNA deacylase [Tuberibacillus calidus]